MNDTPVRPPFTPEATIGPFYPGAFVQHMPQDLWNIAPELALHPDGEPLVLTARFWDAHAQPVPSLIVECWQANAAGRYRHPADRTDGALDPQFDGFARLRTSDDGVLRLRTIKPGAHPVPGVSGVVRAPHLRLTIFASGIDRLFTQLFFEGEALNASDPLLQSVPADLQPRLIARRHGADYAIDIVLRGERETPFFDDWH